MVGKGLQEEESREHKIELDRIVAMLSRLGGRGYCVGEEADPYGYVENDPDPDSDSDFDDNRP